MKKRIGGFFEIEVTESGSNLVEDSVLKHWTSGNSFGLFSTARSIILALREELNSINIWIPEIYCDAFKGIDCVKSYLLGKNSFDPDIQFLDENIKDNDIVLVVDYFGTEVSSTFKEYIKEKSSVYWVEDAAHNLSPLKNWSDFTLFSPRKLIGVAEGGVLVQNTSKKQVINFTNWNVDATPSNISIAPFLRLIFPEYSNLHNVYRVEESNLDNRLRTMSEFTQWQLQNICMDKKILQRKENFLTLRDEFGELLPSGLDFKPETVPFGFPIYIKNRDEIQKRLSEHFVFAPIHWNNQGFSKSHRQSRHEDLTLTIPCDHRYSSEDMECIKYILKRCLAN